MKFQPDAIDAPSISAYGPGWISVAGEKIHTSLILGSRGERIEWPCARFEDLTESHFAQVAHLGAEVVIFGSGERLRFPHPAWIAPLIERGTGLETMDVQAACRTYNILASEGRHVLLALLMEST